MQLLSPDLPKVTRQHVIEAGVNAFLKTTGCESLHMKLHGCKVPARVCIPPSCLAHIELTSAPEYQTRTLYKLADTGQPLEPLYTSSASAPGQPQSAARAAAFKSSMFGCAENLVTARIMFSRFLCCDDQKGVIGIFQGPYRTPF